MRVLVTGGSGSLGRILCRVIGEDGHAVRVLSTRPRASFDPAGFEWACADLARGEGLREAVDGVQAVFHLASDFNNAEAVDVEGTRRLCEASRAAGVSHLVYISIVGIDDIPTGYYKRKREAERIVESSSLPHSIQRATQFHSFVANLLSKAARVPLLMPLPAGFKFQSVDESEVAARLAACLAAGPRGRLVDFGGPEVLDLDAMARSWMEVKGVRRRLVPLPVPGAAAKALRAGKNTAPGGERGTVRWREWLERHAEREGRSGANIYRLPDSRAKSM
ncbi:MAG TPA: NAD(P)H-binding protein [Pyrinomonadaceae bacterium]|nr:NAD(P)H-binding protein [Pyrinomonadaceae bacterium]